MPTPLVFTVRPAGPITVISAVGEGRGPVVEPIVAVPWTLVGEPSFSGEKLAVTSRVSAAHAAAAAARHPHSTPIATRALALDMVRLRSIA